MKYFAYSQADYIDFYKAVSSSVITDGRETIFHIAPSWGNGTVTFFFFIFFIFFFFYCSISAFPKLLKSYMSCLAIILKSLIA